MELRHLQTFKTIVEEGSFVQAADKLQYAQPTITLQIQQLEEEVGSKLFDRQRKKIQLTRAGHMLLAHAIQVLNQIEQMHQDLQDLSQGESGHLRIGLIEPIASVYLADVLATFCEQHPKIRLTIEILSTIMTHERVAAGEIDLGISTPPSSSSGLSFEPLRTEQMVLLIPQQHPLQQQEHICLRDLQYERILLTNPPCAYRTVIEQAFIAQGTSLSTSIEIGGLPTIKQAVQRGLGIAILPQIATQPTPCGTAVKMLQDWNFHLPIGLIKKMVPLAQGKAIEALSTLFKQTIVGKQVERSHT
jgi:DNA-binding transcriptional LysR family regulator